MRKYLKFLVTFVVVAVLFLSIPLSANAQSDKSAFSQSEATAQLRDSMVARENTITVQVYSDDETSLDVELFYDAVAHDGEPTHGDYLQFHCKKVSPTTEVVPYGDGYLQTITYQITYRTTVAQEAAVNREVEKILTTLDVYDATDYEKVAAIYKYLCANVQQDMIGSLTGATDIYTTYGALVNKSAVCQGFASAFYRLALELGVDNRLISGKVGTVLHGWNIVKLDGVYYNVDATKDAGFSFHKYNHFLKSELTTHTRDGAYNSAAFHQEYPMSKTDYLHTTHYWDEGKVTVVANGYREGEKHFTCKVCENTRVEKLPKQGWAQINGKWYSYRDGELETGWKTSGTARFYLNADGSMQTGWRWINGTWYLFDNEGRMLTGWQKNGGHWYYMNAEGKMQTGWRKLSGNWYYFSSDGARQTGWEKVGGIWYYMNASGIMQTGWQRVDGVWYYLNSEGAMQIGWRKLSGVWYYLNSAGAMQVGWRKIDGIWYYFDSEGAMKTGWQKIGGVWYYFYSSGAMATGTVRIGTTTYRFNSSGAWIS